MSWDFVGPAFELKHRVLVQELGKQEHAVLGGSTETAPLVFSPIYLNRRGWAESGVSPTSLPGMPGGLSTEEHGFSSL